MSCGCTSYIMNGNCNCGDCPVSVAAPLDGNGTLAAPLTIDFERLTGTEAGFIADAICSSTGATMALATCLLSADADNDLGLGTDGLLHVAETVTSLAYNPATTLLSYTDENGNVTVADLSALAADIYVSGGTYNAASMQLTLTDNDATTPDVVVDLSGLVSNLTNNLDGTFSHVSGAGTTVAFATVSQDINNIVQIGSDHGPFLSAIDVANAIAGTPAAAALVQGAVNTDASSTIANNGNGTYTHNDGNGNTGLIQIVSADAGNVLNTGGDNGSFVSAQDIANALCADAGAAAIINSCVAITDVQVQSLLWNPVTFELTINETNGDNHSVDLSVLGTVSADAGNDLIVGTDGLPYLAETVTTLTNNAGVLTFTDEAGVVNTINLSVGTLAHANNTLTYTNENGGVTAIALNVGSLTHANNVLTYTRENGTTQTIDLNESVVSLTQAGNRIARHTSANGTIVDINETITSLTFNAATNTLTYTPENGVAQVIVLPAAGGGGSVGYSGPSSDTDFNPGITFTTNGAGVGFPGGGFRSIENLAPNTTYLITGKAAIEEYDPMTIPSGRYLYWVEAQ